jgi:CspA family cold shock protein
MTEKGVKAEEVRRIRERRSGVVNRYYTNKGYGMITPDSDEQDIFVHYSSIVSQREFKRLKEGQQVDYSSFRFKIIYLRLDSNHNKRIVNRYGLFLLFCCHIFMVVSRCFCYYEVIYKETGKAIL